MEYFKDIFRNIFSSILISPDDSEEQKAKKINLYYFIGSPILLIIICWIIFMVFTTSNNNVKVPMVKGDTIYKALKKLSDKRLVTSVNTRYTNDVEANIVYSQSPKQGSTVRRGRIVKLDVSLGHARSELPDFTKFDLFYVEEYLTEKFPSGKVPFKIEDPVYEFNDKFEKGKIFKQEPEKGVSIYDIKQLKFWVSNGIKDDSTSTIKNYVGRNIEDVSKEIVELELYYTFEYEIIDNRTDDMIVTAQSINEGKMIDELMEEGKKIVLKVNKYFKVDKDKISGTYPLELPKKPIPYFTEVKLKNEGSKEKSIFKIKSKGGATYPVLYSGSKDSKLLIYYDGKFQKEISLDMELNLEQ